MSQQEWVSQTTEMGKLAGEIAVEFGGFFCQPLVQFNLPSVGEGEPDESVQESQWQPRIASHQQDWLTQATNRIWSDSQKPRVCPWMLDNLSSVSSLWLNWFIHSHVERNDDKLDGITAAGSGRWSFSQYSEPMSLLDLLSSFKRNYIASVTWVNWVQTWNLI